MTKQACLLDFLFDFGIFNPLKGPKGPKNGLALSR